MSERPFLPIGSVLGIELLDADLHRKVGVKGTSASSTASRAGTDS